MFPGFFGWVIPHNEKLAEFGAGVQLPNSAFNAWNHLLKLKGAAAPKPRGWTIPIEVRKKTAAKINTIVSFENEELPTLSPTKILTTITSDTKKKVMIKNIQTHIWENRCSS